MVGVKAIGFGVERMEVEEDLDVPLSVSAKLDLEGVETLGTK